MRFSNKKYFSLFDFLILIISLLVSLKLQYSIFYKVNISVLDIFNSHIKAFIILTISWFVIADYIKLYSIKRLNYLRETVQKIIGQSFFLLVITFTLSGLKNEDLLSNKLILGFSSFIFVYLTITRIFFFFVTRSYFNQGHNLRRVLIIGENKNTKRLKNILENRRHLGYSIIDDIILDENLESTVKIIQQHKIKEIFIAQSGIKCKAFENNVINYCEINHIKINYVPHSLDDYLISLEVEYVDTLPIFKLKKYPLDRKNAKYIKQAFDTIFSLCVCIFILSWLFPIIGILIKIDSRGNVIFKQKRRGLNGKVFYCYKFRTMNNDGSNSIKATIKNDNRITKIGSFLRRTSLDELPQFLNVLKGDMSIVGPRPHMISQDEYYSYIIKKYNLRHYVKPGITGLAQVKGFRGSIGSNKDMEDRIRIDIFYVRNWSIFLDIQIIYQTIILTIKGDDNAI